MRAPSERQPSVDHMSAVRPQPVARLSARSLSALWYRHSIRTQLLIIVIAIEIAAMLVGAAVTILKARTSTRVEIEASTKLAEPLVNDAVRLIHDDTPARQVLENLPLQLRFLRHVRISVRDMQGTAITPAATVTAADTPAEIDRGPAPAWFYALIAPPIESRVIPIVANGRQIGSVLIVSEPGDEIAEVWSNTVALGFVALSLNIAVIGSLYILFGRALAPLTGFNRGLADLERRNYQVRLATSKAREFATLTARFNALAEALEIARAENVRLGHRLITAQDDERKHTALELHDEVGPSLFGLKATATSIANVAGERFDGSRAMLTERVNDMLAIIEHLQAINRNLLNRLRPMALGHIPLQDLVAQVIRDRAREHPHIAFSFSAAELARSYGDAVDLTIYRCIQESLTNAIRHAEPRNVVVTLGQTPDGDRSIASAASPIEFIIRDDGRGIAADAPRGFGLQGMHERVRALGGEFAITPRPEGGTSVRVLIPTGEWLPVAVTKTNEQE